MKLICAALPFGLLLLCLLAVPLALAQGGTPTSPAPLPTPTPTPTPDTGATLLRVLQECYVAGPQQCSDIFFKAFGWLGVIVIAVVLFAIGAILSGFFRQPIESIGEWLRERVVRTRDRTPYYLQEFVAENERFGFHGSEELFVKQLELDRAYVALGLIPEPDAAEVSRKATSAKGEFAGEEGALLRGAPGEKPKALRLPEVLEKTRQRRLSIIGDAGSGKSALLQWAGLSVARHRRGHGKLSQDQKDFLHALGVNRFKPAPIPILIRLTDFVSHCKDSKRAIDAPALYHFITTLGERRYPSLKLRKDFFDQCLAQRCLLMFDGMDEVDQDDRDVVRAAVEDMAHSPQYQWHFFFVTSRPSAADVVATLPDFRRVTVQPLTPEQREELIHLWCNAMYATMDEAYRKEIDLLRRVEDDERVRSIAETPLMVNVIALVYWHQRDLPRQRAELYEVAIELLIREPWKDPSEVLKYWGGLEWQTRLDLINLIAFVLHDDKNLEYVLADQLVAREAVWRRFGAEKEQAQEAAKQFLRKDATRGALLRQSGNRYDFYIRRFQEYLAGRYVAHKLEDRWSEYFQKHLADDQWEEPLLLGAGFLRFTNIEKAEKYVRQLAQTVHDTNPEDHARAVTLAGMALAEVLEKADFNVQQTFAKVRDDLPPRMLAVFEQNAPLVVPRLRRDLGLALGALGDPRLTPTPTLPRSLLRQAQDARTGEGMVSPLPSRTSTGEGLGVGAILPSLIPIPAGSFLMGTSGEEAAQLKAQDAEAYPDEQPQHPVSVSEFDIGKYPVTNAEFSAFFDAKGYEQERFWSDDGKRWLRGEEGEPDLSWLPTDELKKAWKDWLARRPKEKRGQPFFWDDAQWNAPNLPVVGVTWYEAEAYCKWLSEVTGQKFRLPTEAEWEKATRWKPPPQPSTSAKSAEQAAAQSALAGEGVLPSPVGAVPTGEGLGMGVHYLWPWGDTWDKDKCNSSESGFGATTPVGMYPNGAHWVEMQHAASLQGVLDMVGNVWEWCADRYDDHFYEQCAQLGEVRDPTGPESGTLRVLRGGSWFDQQRFCRAAVRGRGHAAVFFLFAVGFRVVRSPVST